MVHNTSISRDGLYPSNKPGSSTLTEVKVDFKPLQFWFCWCFVAGTCPAWRIFRAKWIRFKEIMTSSSALTDFRTGPLYFFDQPRRRNRIKETRSHVLYLANEAARLEETTQSGENDIKEGKGDELTQRLSGETCADGKPDTSPPPLNIKDHDPVDAYKRAAPQLLNDLACLLSQHKWTERGCIPHGIVNILNYSWQDLTAGVVHLKSPEQADKRGESKGSLKFLDDAQSCQASANDKREARERNSCAVESVGASVRKLQVSSNPRLKKRKQNYSRAHNSTTVSFSISSSSCKHPGWIVQPQQPSCDEPQWISLCQWVVERLQTARNPEKLQQEQELNKPLILRHYGDTKAKPNVRRTKIKSQPVTLIGGLPQIPEVKQRDSAQQKLHYRIDDGSSFIYYPSGCVAVCQSHSGLPRGGFYTNVFSDSERPVILATITASLHGAVNHPLSSVVTTVWDQVGGFICDHHGNVTKEWSWQSGRTPREKIVIQLSDLISVTLLSGTSATLSFRCNNESIQLPLSALSDINRSKETPCLRTEGKLTSDAAQDLLLTRNTKSPAVVLESRRNLTPVTPVSVCPQEVLQMVRDVERLEEPSAQWRRGGPAGRELRRLQQRVRNTLEDWLDYYRVAIGIECPDMERMPDAPLRTRLRREVQSAALPSLNPPEWADAKPDRPEGGRNELQELRGGLSASAETPLESYVRLPRKSKKQTKEEPHVTQIGPLQIHGNIKPESVIIPNSPTDLQPCAVARCPAPPSFGSSAPLTACPALLRAALLGEGGRRRCCCSATLMPAVTDLEYDAFVTGQPPHSQQILVVCVNTRTAAPGQDELEQLYRRRNKHRTTPCSQCQMDSFRLVRYEMSTGRPGCGVENTLLQQRHDAAPGMVLMYLRGTLLFVGYSCSVRDLQKQICRTRGDYRLGLSLPPDYKFSDAVKTPAATDAHNLQDAKGGDDTTLCASVEKETATERRNNHVPDVSHRLQRDFCIEPKKPSVLPVVAVITH